MYVKMIIDIVMGRERLYYFGNGIALSSQNSNCIGSRLLVVACPFPTPFSKSFTCLLAWTICALGTNM
jgi:hypothetical protein